MTYIVCSSESEIPQEDHWAIVGTKTLWAKGYDRNEPDESVETLVYKAYSSEAAWKSDIEELVRTNTLCNFTVMKVSVPTINVELKINLLGI